jgi:transcriptional regulator with XRE-family HTH domain
MTEHPDKDLLIRLGAFLDGASPSDIARRAGLAASTLTRVMHGRTDHRLSAPTMDKLREAFPTFFDPDPDRAPQARAYLPVEVLPSFAGMGGGGSGEGDRETALIPRRLIVEKLRASPADLLIIECRGDSMHPDFEHGDQVMIDRRDTDPTQPGPFALWDGDGYVVKLVERIPQRPGWLRIFSINDRYSPYEVEAQYVRIMGRPVWYAREL